MRCTVGIVGLRQRLASGMTPEEAISSESRHDQRVRNGSAIYTAFGASKPMRMWLADPRCVVRARELNLRLQRGVPFVQALTDPLPIKFNRPIDAFGESKTIMEWSRDPRCEVDVINLRQRLRHGFTLEEALRQECRKEPLVRYEALGESKTLSDWAKDPRCQVKDTELRRRIAQGIPLEQALTQRRGHSSIEAFGESKPIGAWSKDQRCVVSEPTLTERLALGFPPERALTDPPGTKLDGTPYPHPRAKMIYAFGEGKSLREWERDGRAAVTRKAIEFRLKMGWSPELAITLGIREAAIAMGRASYQIEAFGEVKSLFAWARDKRAKVDRHTIRDRIARGYPPEIAISAEPHDGACRPKNPVRLLEAFGEAKSLGAWAKDPRAQVGSKAIGERLHRGYSPEQAISEPSERLSIRPFWDIERRGIPLVSTESGGEAGSGSTQDGKKAGYTLGPLRS